MQRQIILAIVGLWALSIGGCASEETSTAPSESPSASPTASPSPAAAQPFNKPLVAQKDSKLKGDSGKKTAVGTLSIPELQKSTDPLERARQVQAGIKSGKGSSTDPFASLSPLISFKTPVVPSTLPPESKEGESTRLPSLPNFPKPPATIPTIRFRSQPPVAINPRPGLPSQPTAIPTIPPLPEPTLARAVEVSGVVMIRGTAQAIVKAPNEPTSRYVSAGQRLSNGQVLVKRIEVFSGSDPVVILEENGVEVARPVGSKGSKAA
ncbi:hypothetical protein [Alkalinema sp. FACHB-956]|uniref:hypothetical protein n=1 Tax=Alkalinema sp. FACHB-956 TaxID=2692768 RepID=UPI0016860EBE|nr:hypothetical protein [Alkalinema sp. FACHB-956]MBD2326624.1 hypothetical protein [Alkalinema sp. FACHB-956]